MTLVKPVVSDPAAKPRSSTEMPCAEFEFPLKSGLIIVDVTEILQRFPRLCRAREGSAATVDGIYNQLGGRA